MESLRINCLILLSIISTASLAVQMWDIRYLWPQRNSTIRTVLLSSFNPYDTLVGGEMGMDREVILGLSIPEVRNWFRPFIFSSDFGRLNMYPGNISNCIPRSINISIFMSLSEKSWWQQSTAGFRRLRHAGSAAPISAWLDRVILLHRWSAAPSATDAKQGLISQGAWNIPQGLDPHNKKLDFGQRGLWCSCD